MKNLLIIGKGDTNYSDRNPRRLYRQAKKKGFEVHRLEYGDAPPKLDDGIINVFLFFPYQFWNEICEVPQDTELYGTSGKVCDLLDDFFLKTDDILSDLLLLCFGTLFVLLCDRSCKV